ncbi:dynein heavy chain [Massospora cicadina]|nr:dynein heavy chain [Massospora cicadina]
MLLGVTVTCLEKIPWCDIHALLVQSIYGSKINYEFDQNLVESFVKTMFLHRICKLYLSLVKASEDIFQPLLIQTPSNLPCNAQKL